MKNPKIPSMHFNTRFICTQKSWFGGGMDLTPSYKNNNQKKWYHLKLKKMCSVARLVLSPRPPDITCAYRHSPIARKLAGGPELALEVEQNGYGDILAEVV